MVSTEDHVSRLFSTGFACLFVLGASPAARAELATGTCAAVMDPGNAPSSDPRLDHLIVDGVHVNVLLPADYHATHRRYPVLYLFHGAFGDEDSFSTQTDLLGFTAGLRAEDQAIVVMPDGGHLPAGRDWVDGTHHQESFVIGTLLPFVAAHYRTLEDRSHRAAAGFSAGGMNAMVFAARHPDLFVAAGSFSGFVDPFDPAGVQVIEQFAALDNELCSATDDPFGLWGDPDLHPMGWQAHDPRDLAGNLEGVSLYIASGSGVPCPGDPDDPFLEFAEATVLAMSQHLDEALTAARIRHVTELRACGVHLFSNAGPDLRRFWPEMLRAFGRPAPHDFDYRTGDASAAVWGWQLAADPARAPEFVELRGASRRGVEVTGSGAQAITTAPLFGRRQRVRIAGAGPASQVVRADDAGRLAFTVDLGPPHTLEQGTPAEQAAAASDPRYFATRTVRFEPVDHDGY
jgi:S-formylglutathione hydrolase FrmB